MSTASLKKIIDWLSACPPDAVVRFSDGTCPKGIDSSRGSYSELAIGYRDNDPPLVMDMLQWLCAAVGKTFTGYKGGEYRMYENTDVWRDQWGEWTETAIIGGRCVGKVATIAISRINDTSWTVEP